MGVTLIAARPEAPSPAFVVIKRPYRHLLTETTARQRFHHEAALASAISHPHLVQTLVSGEDIHGPYIVLEYVHGVTLTELVDRAFLGGKRLPTSAVLNLALQCAAGLTAMHEARDPRGMPLHAFHRDITPPNILITAGGIVKLGDFGIARSCLSEASTDAQTLLGKLAYLAPEYLIQNQSSPALDIYALGIALFYAFIGRTPHRAKSERELLLAVLREPFPPEPLAQAGVPAPLADLMIQMCAREPAARPTARELYEAFAGLAASGPQLKEVVDLLAGLDLTERWRAFNEQACELHA